MIDGPHRSLTRLALPEVSAMLNCGMFNQRPAHPTEAFVFVSRLVIRIPKRVKDGFR